MVSFFHENLIYLEGVERDATTMLYLEVPVYFGKEEVRIFWWKRGMLDDE